MTRIEHIAMIAHDMGLIFEFLGVASLLPFLVLVIFREWDLLLPMATAPVTFFILGYAISHLPYRDIEPSFSITMSAVALAWLAIAFIGALPFVAGLGMSYTDAVFEAMSGWTGTGFTMITTLDATPGTLLFWRSFMHWVGGIGIIAFGISLHRKTRLSLFRLYRAEGREEELVSTAASSGRRMWMIYSVLTLAFTGLIMITGVPLWDSLNLVMVAIATGGLTALYSLTASAIRISGGSISDRLGGERTALLSLTIMAIGAVIMSFSQSLALSVVGVVVMAVGMGITNAAVFKLMPQYVHEAVGGASGLPRDRAARAPAGAAGLCARGCGLQGGGDRQRRDNLPAAALLGSRSGRSPLPPVEIGGAFRVGFRPSAGGARLPPGPAGRSGPAPRRLQ